MILREFIKAAYSFQRISVYDDLTGLHSDEMEAGDAIGDTCYSRQVYGLLDREVRSFRVDNDSKVLIIFVKEPNNKPESKGE